MQTIVRGLNQSAVIDGDIVVTILAIYDDHVRVSIHSERLEPRYFETDLYLPDDSGIESLEFELSLN